MKGRPGRRLVPVLLVTALVMGSGTSHALQMEWGAGATLEFTDNVRRTATDRRSDQIGMLWAGVWLREDKPTLRMALSSTLEYRDYQKNTYDDDNLFDLSAMLTASLIPQRLHWHLEDYFQQIRITDLDPMTPDNRQDSNVFWTGPDVFFRFGPATELQLGARVGHNYYGRSDADNFRAGASTRLTRRIWSRLDGFVHLESLHVWYEHPHRFTDYNRYDALAGIDYRMRATDIRLEFGHSWLDRDDGAQLDDMLAAVRITRRLPRDSAAGLTYSQHYTDAGATLLAAGPEPMRAERVGLVVPRGVVYERLAEAYYIRALGMIDVRLAAFWGDEEVVIPSDDPGVFDEDRELIGARLDLGYRFDIQWSVAAYLSYQESDYDEIDRRDKDWLAGIRTDYRFSRHFTAALELVRDERRSNFATEEFRENLVFVSVRYGERPPLVPL